MANDLTPTQPSSPPARQSMRQISSGLKSLLTIGDANAAIRELIRNPVMLSEAKMALPMLKQEAMAPAGVEGVQRVVGRRRAMFPGGPKTAEESAAWWSDYYAALADLPEAALEAGMSAHIMDPQSEFMPKPGKLRALALASPNYAAKAYERARDAIIASEPKPQITRADKAAVERMMEDYRSKIVKPPEPVQRAFPPPPTDEQGLSPAMRKVIADRESIDG